MSSQQQPTQPLVIVKEEYQATLEETQNYLSQILDKISSRFTKKYLPPIENSLQENYYFIPVEFFERKNIYLHIRGKNNCYIVTLVINLYVSRLEGVTKM